jgi:L-aspartate oxidase
VETKEILVIGTGIAGCAVALALAKRGIAVTLMASPFDQRVYHAPFINHDSLEEKVSELQLDKQEQLSCSRAYEQLATTARTSIDELLGPRYLMDRNGNIDIHRCLQEQLREQPHVEWITRHSVIELLTLDQHSQKKADCYKKPSCFGVIAYNHESKLIDYILAKETILATGGATSLYPYSTHSSTACGDGIAMAHRAGARLLNMDLIQFHPLGLYEKDKPCFPLPLELLQAGGKIVSLKSEPIEVEMTDLHLCRRLYDHLLQTRDEHLWLDLTMIDPTELKETFPFVDNYCLNHGYNIVKECLPLVPAAAYFCGGIAIDRTAQTSLQRLRAIGEVACTGLFWNFRDETLGVLESLTWALSCADDLAKQATKLVYYFPEVREGSSHPGSSSSVLKEDWKLLRQIMWSYVGIKQDRTHLERGCAMLDHLYLVNAAHDLSMQSIEQIQLFYAIQTAQLIGHAARAQQGINATHPPRFSSLFQTAKNLRLF